MVFLSLPWSDPPRNALAAPPARKASGFVSNTEMWCRLVPKGASPLVPRRTSTWDPRLENPCGKCWFNGGKAEENADLIGFIADLYVNAEDGGKMVVKHPDFL